MISPTQVPDKYLDLGAVDDLIVQFQIGLGRLEGGGEFNIEMGFTIALKTN